MTHLKIGDSAPDFSSSNFDAKSFLGHKIVVLYFYPKDDTPGCTIEAQEFSKNSDIFASLGAVVLGVSKDSQQSHQKFKDKYCLAFDLISDDKEICNNYGVWAQKSMFGKSYMGVERSTFLIDKNGKIAYIWDKVKVNDHALEVIDKIRQLDL